MKAIALTIGFLVLVNSLCINLSAMQKTMTLHQAAAAGNANEIRRLILEEGVSVKSLDREKQTALHVAAQANQIKAAKALLELGVPIDATSKYVGTAQEYAEARGYDRMVALIENYRALRANTKDKKSQTPSVTNSNNASRPRSNSAQTRTTYDDRFEEQDQRIRELEEELRQLKGSPAKSGKKVSQRVVRQNDIDGLDSRGLTALHRAAAEGDAQKVYDLLERGVNVNAQTALPPVCTPLELAIENRRWEICKILLANNANIQQEFIISVIVAGDTAAGEPARIEILKLLMARGVDLDVAYELCGPALHEAAARNFKGIMQLLLQSRCDVYALNYCSQTALHRVTSAAAAQILLDAGAEIDASDKDGNTPLYEAVGAGNIPLVKFLFDRGANPDAPNNKGFTPFNRPASLEMRDCLKHLRVDPVKKKYDSPPMRARSSTYPRGEAPIKAQTKVDWQGMGKAITAGAKLAQVIVKAVNGDNTVPDDTNPVQLGGGAAMGGYPGGAYNGFYNPNGYF